MLRHLLRRIFVLVKCPVIDELSQANRDNLNTLNKFAELNKSILLLEETVQAFDAYRRQNNEMLQEMQLKISNIESPTSP